MPKWATTLSGALLAAGLGFLAFLAAARASRAKDQTRRWQDRAVAEEESDVAGSAERAKQARAQEKLHGAAATRAEDKTKERINAINSHEPTMADVTAAWRKPGGVRERTDT